MSTVGVGSVKRDWFALFAVFAVAYVIFRCAPVQQLHDSKYTMLLAENIGRHHDLDLARYGLPPDDYHLVAVGNHRYYYFPEGSALLSVPFVELMRLRGVSTVGPDGSYNLPGELSMDARLAALLMAAFAAVVYATARLLLPVIRSLGLTAAAVLGTQVFSTASRSVWSDTWGILLIALAIFLLLRSAVRGAPERGLLLGACLGFGYVVRPTNLFALLAVGLYLAQTNSRVFLRFASGVTAIVGPCVFEAWRRFHSLLPPYFAAGRLTFRTPVSAIAGNLISPSRGLLVFVPSVLVLAAALVRFRESIRYRPLLRLSLFVVAAHFAVLAGYWDWWGGHSYGPRLTTSLVPWLGLLGILACDAIGTRRLGKSRDTEIRYWFAAASLLVVLSVGMNAIGACSSEADRWNVSPDNINADLGRLWDWRRPQFLAPFSVPIPAEPQ